MNKSKRWNPREYFQLHEADYDTPQAALIMLGLAAIMIVLSDGPGEWLREWTQIGR